MATTKYDFKDDLWFIYKQGAYEQTECGFCKGTKNLIIASVPQELIICPTCSGKGTVNGKWKGAKWTCSTHRTKIIKIHIESSYISYRDCHGNDYEEEDLHLTREDALIECDKRNGVL
jgi:hypothetical protein